MNNEIKEILEALRDSIDDTGTDKVNFINWIDKIEDCITNLQQKYEEADNDRHKLFEQKEKAIEYINKYLEREYFDYDILETNTIYNRNLFKVKKILNGDDKSEN